MRLAFATVLALAATPLIAQQLPKTAPGAPIPSRVEAGTYKVDSSHSQILFTVNHLGFSNYTGQFIDPTGTLTLDPKDPANSKVEVNIPIAKVSTTAKALDDHLQKPEFFDAAKFPEGKFVSTAVTITGTTAKIAGNLTLKGVTKPVILHARFIGAGPAPMPPKKTNVGFSATTSIKRSDFGINYGIPLVPDKVDLVINVAFEAE